MKRFGLLLLLLISIATASAQDGLSPIWKAQLDQWTFTDNSTDIDEAIELLTLLHEYPTNLNDTSQLSQLFFLSPTQTKALCYYIDEYGQLLSLTELHLINGFDNTTIALLEPIAVTKPYSTRERLNLQNIARHAEHHLTIGTGRNLELSRGFSDSIYEGDPYRLYWVYSLNYQNRIRFQISADKDPGEALFYGSQKNGFDFYGANLTLNDIGRIRRLTIGHYRLQFGQGLTLWKGARPWHSGTGGSYRNAQKISLATPFSEYGFLQGAAATIRVSKHLDATTFYSVRNIDASTIDSLNVRSISYSGYHRTPTEQAKRGVLNQQLFGFNLDYSCRRFHIGTTFQAELFSKNIQPDLQPYNQYYFSGNRNLVGGVDATYQLHYTTLYGEISRSLNGGMAGIIGLHTPLGNGSQLNLQLRDYGTDFQNHNSSAWGQSSSTQNELGANISLRCRLPLQIEMTLFDDHFRHPWLKYQTYSPTSGNEQGITLSRRLSDSIQASVSYHRKEFGRNGIDSSSHTYNVEQVTRQSLKGRLSYSYGPFSGQTDICISRFACELHRQESGTLISQQISYHKAHSPLHFESRFSLFDASSYDAALYAYEDDLRYEYSSSTFSSQGLRFYLIARYNLNEKISLSAKYSITSLADQSTIGSGYDLVPSNHRQSVKLQLHCSF